MFFFICLVIFAYISSEVEVKVFTTKNQQFHIISLKFHYVVRTNDFQTFSIAINIDWYHS